MRDMTQATACAAGALPVVQYVRFVAIFQPERFFTELQLQPATPSQRHRDRARLREPGRAGLIESTDWVRLLRDRPVALAKG
jgi:hypothetical protein